MKNLIIILSALILLVAVLSLPAFAAGFVDRSFLFILCFIASPIAGLTIILIESKNQ